MSLTVFYISVFIMLSFPLTWGNHAYSKHVFFFLCHDHNNQGGFVNDGFSGNHLKHIISFAPPATKVRNHCCPIVWTIKVKTMFRRLSRRKRSIWSMLRCFSVPDYLTLYPKAIEENKVYKVEVTNIFLSSSVFIRIFSYWKGSVKFRQLPRR